MRSDFCIGVIDLSDEKIFCPRCGSSGARSLKTLSEKSDDPKFAQPKYDRRRLILHVLSIAMMLGSVAGSKSGLPQELSMGLLVLGFVTFVIFKDNKFPIKKRKWEHGFFCQKCQKISVVDEMD